MGQQRLGRHDMPRPIPPRVVAKIWANWGGLEVGVEGGGWVVTGVECPHTLPQQQSQRTAPAGSTPFPRPPGRTAGGNGCEMGGAGVVGVRRGEGGLSPMTRRRGTEALVSVPVRWELPATGDADQCRTWRTLNILATSVCQLRHDQMEQGPTEPHAGHSTFLLSFSGAGVGGGRYYLAAFDMGQIATDNQFPWRTPVQCLTWNS